MVTKSLVEVPFSVHGLIFIESVRGPFVFNKRNKISIMPKIMTVQLPITFAFGGLLVEILHFTIE